jgi:signal peptidase II
LCGVGFLIGGAAGNLWDRIIFSHVIDFLDFVFINFPVFNLSDVSVDIGIGLIIIGSLRRK